MPNMDDPTGPTSITVATQFLRERGHSITDQTVRRLLRRGVLKHANADASWAMVDHRSLIRAAKYLTLDQRRGTWRARSEAQRRRREREREAAAAKG